MNMTLVSLERIGLALADGQACLKGNHVRGLWAPETRIAQPRET